MGSISLVRPSKTDSAPVRGNGYEPGSSQSQRRDVAQRAIGPSGGGCEYWGGSEKFLDGGDCLLY